MCRLKNYFLISAQKWSNNYKKKEIIEKVKVNLLVYFLFFLTKHHDMKTSWGSGGKNLHILNLDTIWRWMVSFSPSHFISRERALRYPLDRRLSRAESRSWRGGGGKNSFPRPSWESNPGRLSRSLVTTLTSINCWSTELVELCLHEWAKAGGRGRQHLVFFFFFFFFFWSRS